MSVKLSPWHYIDAASNARVIEVVKPRRFHLQPLLSPSRPQSKLLTVYSITGLGSMTVVYLLVSLRRLQHKRRLLETGHAPIAQIKFTEAAGLPQKPPLKRHRHRPFYCGCPKQFSSNSKSHGSNHYFFYLTPWVTTS
jgi:hypothetical protein